MNEKTKGEKGKKKRTELLAPAGTFAHLRAAVNSGADAVYAGGKFFSARAGAGNFDEAEMREAADYCHLRGVRLYVTVNTLIFDAEMEAALRYAEYLYEIGVDALIVQDLGFASAVRRRLPDFPLHLSTQATIYSREGALFAARMGFERVVLARETPLAEMRAVQSALDKEGLQTELEVFVHGALCFCVSGQCQFSRFRGGRSGNRGACAQPCRLPYADESGRVSYRLSPKDLCTVDSLGELCDCGARSLKIEGRMKSPEYVAVVTGVYRKYLDAYERDGFYRVSPEDRRALLQIFNRGGFTGGYLFGNPAEKLMSGRLPKHQGVRIGRVVRRGKNDSLEIELAKGERLALGDGVEIRRPEMARAQASMVRPAGKLPGNVVTYRKELSSDGRRLLIGDIRGAVQQNDEVFKITDSALAVQAARQYMLDRDGRELTVRRTPVAMRLTVRCGKPAALTVWEQESACDREGRALPAVTVLANENVERALYRPVAAERLTAQLAKTGDSVFCVRQEEIKVLLDEDAVLPMAAVNELRREALAQLAAQKAAAQRRTLPAQGAGSDAMATGAWAMRQSAIYVHVFREETPSELAKAAMQLRTDGVDDLVVFLPVKTYLERYLAETAFHDALWQALGAGWARVSVLPFVSHVSMGEEDAYVRAHFDAITAAVRTEDGAICCGNAGWLAEFARTGCRTVAGFGLNAVNRHAAEFLIREVGASAVMPSLELAPVGDADGAGSVGSTGRAGGAVRAGSTDDASSERSREGRFGYTGALPLMTTAHLLPEERFYGADGIGAGSGAGCYCSVTGAYGDQSLIFRDDPFRTLLLYKSTS